MPEQPIEGVVVTGREPVTFDHTPIPVDGFAMLGPRDVLVIYVRSAYHSHQEIMALKESVAVSFPPEFKDRIVIIAGTDSLAVMRGAAHGSAS